MAQTVILGAARTPFGKLGGALASFDATDLGGTAIAAALERADVDGGQVDKVVMGQVLQAGQGQIPSRQAQIKGGIPKDVPSETVNKVCASGIRAVGLIDAAVRAGDLDTGVAGGMESMSNAPYLLPNARFGYRMGDAKAIDGMIRDGLTNPFTGKHMMQEASEVASELELTRPDMDRWALRSHELAIKATDEGRLPEEIVSVTVKSKKGESTVEVDEAPRRETTLEALAKLPPQFVKDGSHTAGNAPGVNDGAGALMLASDEWAKKEGRTALARIVASAEVADDFPYLARTPGKAAKLALERAGHDGRPDRSVGDQRGVCLGGDQLRAHARDRRREGERERWRDRAGPPDRRVRRAHPDDAGVRAAAARRRSRLRGDLLRRRPGRRGDHRGQRRLRLSRCLALTRTTS